MGPAISRCQNCSDHLGVLAVAAQAYQSFIGLLTYEATRVKRGFFEKHFENIVQIWLHASFQKSKQIVDGHEPDFAQT